MFPVQWNIEVIILYSILTYKAPGNGLATHFTIEYRMHQTGKTEMAMVFKAPYSN